MDFMSNKCPHSSKSHLVKENVHELVAHELCSFSYFMIPIVIFRHHNVCDDNPVPNSSHGPALIALFPRRNVHYLVISLMNRLLSSLENLDKSILAPGPIISRI